MLSFILKDGFVLVVGPVSVEDKVLIDEVGDGEVAQNVVPEYFLFLRVVFIHDNLYEGDVILEGFDYCLL